MRHSFLLSYTPPWLCPSCSARAGGNCIPDANFLNSWKRTLKSLLKQSFGALGYAVEKRDPLLDLIPHDYLSSPYLPRVYRQSIGRLFYVESMLQQIRGVEGDIVECGVSIGHGLLYFALLSELLDRERQIWGFDSFAGFPQSTDPDSKQDGSYQVDRGDYATPTEMVHRVLADGRVSREMLENNVHLVRGYFEDTLIDFDRPIALLHVDCDLHDSIMTCLNCLYDIVQPDGLIIFDEYLDPNFPGAKRAVDSFFFDKPETVQCYSNMGYERCFVVKR